MVCDIYYGKLKEDYENIESPYDIFEWQEKITTGSVFLTFGDKYFGKARRHDWGSFVWRCTKNQLKELSINEKIEIPGIEELSEKNEYAVAFIESI